MWFKVYTDSLDDYYGKPKTLMSSNYFTEIKPGYDSYYDRYFIKLIKEEKPLHLSKSFVMDYKDTLDRIYNYITKNIDKEVVVDIKELIDKYEGDN